ncbi:transglutaminase [Amycolatopsis taiwanensis]|uniref:Transglutaminase n=1 Tax=Amycolatopsis taiwanensis TaxID=342230 RepID=A0A9W6RAZ5_9PSEU|nr:transglutaminase [Amycolatopsis taiwanensis]
MSPEAYLAEDAVIDFGRPAVRLLAHGLRAQHDDDVEFAKAAFEHVRDNVAHSWDAQDPTVSITASDTAVNGVGLCFAKAHLLAAILRSQGIPTGFCYQRLTDDDQSYLLHGLVAVFLNGDWHRQDPRGNKPGVDAQFSIKEERLAWPVRPERGEHDYPQVFPGPHPTVIAALQATDNVLDLCRGGLPSSL